MAWLGCLVPRDDKELVDAIDWAWQERLTARHLETAFRVIGTPRDLGRNGEETGTPT